MRKIALILVFILAASTLAACSSGQNIEITDKESDAIAEYCAYLLLKHDKNMTDKRKLLDVKELQDIYKENKGESTDADSISGTVTPTPVITPSSVPDKDPDKSDTSSQEGSKDNTATPVPSEIKDNTVKTLTELYAQKIFDIDYVSYSISDDYSENEYSTFNAKTGEKILAVKLKITNNSNEKAKFVSADYPVSYALYCDNGDIIGPSLSMLSNDIQFLNDGISAGKTFESVVIFIIYENRNESGFVLRGTNNSNGKICEIKLK